MITLAIDASSKSTGVAVFNERKLIHYECIIENSTDSLKRVKNMAKKVAKIYEEYKPSDIIMEDVLPEDVKHNQAIYKVLIYLQAAIILTLDQYGKKVNLCTASHWRSICGIKTGRGIKRQQLKKASQQLVKATYNIDVNDDISDAICLGMAYVEQNRSAF